MNKKTFVMLTSDFPPMEGGIANFLHNICDLLSSDTHVLTPLSPGAQEHDRIQSYQVTRLRQGGTFWQRNIMLPMRWFSTVTRIAAKQKELTVCGGFASTAILVVLYFLSFRSKFKTRLIVHGGDLRWIIGRWWQFPHRHALRRIEGFVCNSNYTRRLLVEKLGIESRRVQVFHPGVDECSSSNAPAVQIDGWPPSRPVILSVGRLVRHKGHDNVIKALAKLVDRGLDVGYVIVGRGSEEKRLRQLALSLEIADRVHFAGFVADQDLGSYYRRCDVFALVSREEVSGNVEGFGIVYLEASSMGKPVVAGDSGGVSDAVANGRSGLLVDPNSVFEISEALAKVLSDSEFARKMGDAGRLYVEENFVWCNRLEQLYQAIGPDSNDECVS